MTLSQHDKDSTHHSHHAACSILPPHILRKLAEKPELQERALRAMETTEGFRRAPGTAYDDPQLGKDPQPADMSKYVQTTDDVGGVHINSGIPNRAFYLAATSIGGYAWQRAGLVWYRVLTGSLSPSADFQAMADATVTVAGALFGQNSNEQNAVPDAWSTVGVSPTVTHFRALSAPPRRFMDDRHKLPDNRGPC